MCFVAVLRRGCRCSIDAAATPAGKHAAPAGKHAAAAGSDAAAAGSDEAAAGAPAGIELISVAGHPAEAGIFSILHKNHNISDPASCAAGSMFDG
jgi:hypothetical protein